MWPYEAASTADWYPLSKPTGDEGLYGFTMLVLFSSGGSVESFLSRLFTASKHNIWGLFNTPKREGPGGG